MPGQSTLAGMIMPWLTSIGVYHAIDEARRLEQCLQERLLAALALCSCDSAGLGQVGAGALLQALHDSTDAASKPTA